MGGKDSPYTVTLLKGDVDGPFTGDVLVISPEDGNIARLFNRGGPAVSSR